MVEFLVGCTFEKVDACYGFGWEEGEDSGRSIGYGCCGGSAVARGDGFEEGDGGGGGRKGNGLVGLEEEVVAQSNERWCNTWCSSRWWPAGWG